jgi:sec-independent protein translocase protein TatA
MGSFSIWHWIIVLVIVLLVFGTKRLTSGAKDLGKAVNEFKKGVQGDDKPAQLGDQSKQDASAESQRDGSNADR